MGESLLNTLEVVHNSGLVYNDLKLENIVLGYDQTVTSENSNESILKDVNLHLVDFGLAT